MGAGRLNNESPRTITNANNMKVMVQWCNAIVFLFTAYTPCLLYSVPTSTSLQQHSRDTLASTRYICRPMAITVRRGKLGHDVSASKRPRECSDGKRLHSVFVSEQLGMRRLHVHALRHFEALNGRAHRCGTQLEHRNTHSHVCSARKTMPFLEPYYSCRQLNTLINRSVRCLVDEK